MMLIFASVMPLSGLVQDHNKDYIVEFPDWDPTLDVASEYQHNNKNNNVMLHRSLRGVALESKTSLPQPHLWYSTDKVIKALSLFLDAGKYLPESLTFRYICLNCFV